MAERHLRLVAAKQAVREVEERVGSVAGKRTGPVAERQVGDKADRKADHKDVRQPTAIEFAIAVVSSRSLPEKKLRERLAPRYDADEVDATMTRMRELRLVDDAAWAERFARDRVERSSKGRHRIRNELVARGIDAATADASLAAVLGGAEGADIEREKAMAMLESMRTKLSRSVQEPETAPPEAAPSTSASRAAARNAARRESESLKNRLFRRMLARGYPASLVRDLLDVS